MSFPESIATSGCLPPHASSQTLCYKPAFNPSASSHEHNSNHLQLFPTDVIERSWAQGPKQGFDYQNQWTPVSPSRGVCGGTVAQLMQSHPLQCRGSCSTWDSNLKSLEFCSLTNKSISHTDRVVN